MYIYTYWAIYTAHTWKRYETLTRNVQEPIHLKVSSKPLGCHMYGLDHARLYQALQALQLYRLQLAHVAYHPYHPIISTCCIYTTKSNPVCAVQLCITLHMHYDACVQNKHVH